MNVTRHNTIRLPGLALASVCVLATGCTTVTTQSFRVVDSPNVEAAYIAVGADFEKYDQLMAEDMGIYFPTDAAPSVKDQQRTRQIFREAFLGQLTDYRIVDGKGPTTLLVHDTLIDFRNATGADVPLVRSELRDIARPGALLFLMELKDSTTGEVLARAADSASAPAFSTSTDSVTDWSTVESSVTRWAKLFRRFLDENLNK